MGTAPKVPGDRADRADQAAQDRDEVAQDRARVKAPTPPRIAPVGYTKAKHPDTGLEVVFVAGEALPDWVSLDAEPTSTEAL